MQTILEALCGLAGRSTDEDRWPEKDWSTRTFLEAEPQQRGGQPGDSAEPPGTVLGV